MERKEICDVNCRRRNGKETKVRFQFSLALCFHIFFIFLNRSLTKVWSPYHIYKIKYLKNKNEIIQKHRIKIKAIRFNWPINFPKVLSREFSASKLVETNYYLVEL